MKLNIPRFCLVVLIGPSGCGKSAFARKHFRPTEILSSDFCRGLVSDDESNQMATEDAFEVLHLIAAKRLARRKLTVIDATNVQSKARRPLLELARQHRSPCIGVAFNLPEGICLERNRGRTDRRVMPEVVRKQVRQMRESLDALREEGFQHVYVFSSSKQVDSAVVERRRHQF